MYQDILQVGLKSFTIYVCFGFRGWSVLRIYLSFVIALAAVVVFAYTFDPLPIIEEPLLMTVWGYSPEINTVNYFCNSLFVPRDYVTDVTVEESRKGTGYGLDSDDSSGEFYRFYPRGTPYKTLVVLAGSPVNSSKEDIDRIEELAVYIKSEQGMVMIIDVDTEGMRDEPIKKEFARRLIPLTDIIILAESPIGNYASTLEDHSLFVLELPMIIDLLAIFERDFGGGRCCD